MECNINYIVHHLGDGVTQWVWYCNTHDRIIGPDGRCADKGLGDTVERLLLKIGVTPDTWIRWNSYKIIGGQCPILVKTPKNELSCGCAERKKFLNSILPYESFWKIYNKVAKWGIIKYTNAFKRRQRMTIMGKFDYKTFSWTLLSLVIAGFTGWVAYARHLPTKEEVSAMIAQESQRDIILNDLRHLRENNSDLSNSSKETNKLLHQLSTDVAVIKEKLDKKSTETSH